MWQSSSDAIEIDSFFLPPQKALDLRKTNVVLLQFLRKIRQIIFREEIEEQRQEHWKKEHVSSWGKESVHDAGAPLL